MEKKQTRRESRETAFLTAFAATFEPETPLVPAETESAAPDAFATQLLAAMNDHAADYPTESRFVENSLVIVFSVSGESRDTIGHVMRFKEQNCQILSVTNTENCTIAKLSDYNLAYYVTYERLGVYDVTTQLPAMSIVERLGKKLYRYTSEGPAAI